MSDADGHTMDVGETSSGPSQLKGKRIFNQNEREIDPKRPRFFLEPELKMKVLKSIISMACEILYELKLQDSLNDLYLNNAFSNQLSAFLHAHRMTAKSKSQETAFIKTLSTKGFVIRYRGVDHALPYPKTMTVITKRFEENGLFSKDIARWAVTLSEYIGLLELFQARFNETRIGLYNFILGEDKYIRVTEYGVSDKMIILCGGLNWKSRVKNALAQSVGPLTALIMLQTQTDKRYSNKWKAAVESIFSHIPDIKTIVNSFCDFFPPKQKAEITRILGFITLTVEARNIKYFGFPFFSLIKRFATVSEDTIVINDSIENMDFSGAGGFSHYFWMCKQDWSYPKGEVENEVILKQVFFHSIFDTATKSLDVLSATTDWKQWDPQQEFPRITATPGEHKLSMELKLINLKYISKDSNVSLAHILGRTGGAVCSYSVFSGFRRKLITPGLKSLYEQEAAIKLVGYSYREIETYLLEIARKVEKNWSINARTTWFELIETGYGKEVDLDIREGKIFFRSLDCYL